MIGALPPIHDLAAQAGIDLPAALGRIEDVADTEPENQPARKPKKTDRSQQGASDA